MTTRALCCAAYLLLTVIAPALAQEAPPPLRHGPSPEIAAYQHASKVEIYRLRIVNDEGGMITASRDGGLTWLLIGRVLGYTVKVSRQGYTASKWGPMSAVAATAVNAIHIRTGHNAEEDKGIIFSLLPLEMSSHAVRTAQAQASYMSPNSSIYTDVPAGTGMFGGNWAPILGNPIYRETPAGLELLAENDVPRRGDVLVIRVLQPAQMPRAFVFENHIGGLIYKVDWDGSEEPIGQVLRPVTGVGRFSGTVYADVGRLRANHNGVIDLSVSKFGEVGGIQIIPRGHAQSPEMERARSMTQWMIIGPLDAREPSWEGTAPLFLDYLRPSWGADKDWESPDWLRLVTSRVFADVRIKHGPWQPMPHFTLDPDESKPLQNWANTALQNVTHIRLHLPVPERGIAP